MLTGLRLVPNCKNIRLLFDIGNDRFLRTRGKTCSNCKIKPGVTFQNFRALIDSSMKKLSSETRTLACCPFILETIQIFLHTSVPECAPINNLKQLF